MAHEILINAGVGETRIAVVTAGRLRQLRLERTFGSDASRVGDIVLGRVQKIMSGMQAAFVDIGQARPGFLALGEATILAERVKPGPGISDCVREGETVPVQIIKDPFGNKGARLSAALSVPGRLLVMLPGRPGISVSRRIDDERRAELDAWGKRLQADVPDAGFIFRTEAGGAQWRDICDDARWLAEIWRGIDQKTKSAMVPTTLHADLGPVERTMRELFRNNVERVWIDDAASVEVARAYCRRAMPGAEDHVAFHPPPVFDDALEEEIAGLSRPRVALPSGGWITIEPTEALTAIDVNSGSFTQSSGVEETSLTTDLEAAREIGRQLRLRDIGGLIVVDFIHLTRADHAAKVLEALSRSLTEDGVPVQISPMTEFGIVAIARKRTAVPLARKLAMPETVALELLRRVEYEAIANPGREIVVQAAPAAMEWLTIHEKDVRAGLMRRGAGRVRFETGEREGFDVRTV